MFLNFLMMPILCFLLISCGGSKSSMKVEVTRSFSSTNSSFDGGLYLHGKNLATQEEFSIALGNQSSTSIVLNFGKWDIRVVGWDNSPLVMEGDVLCAHEVIDFKSEEQKASLQVTKDKCNDPALGSSTPVGIYFCGALYDPEAPQNLRSPNNLTTNFCAPPYPKVFHQTDIQGIIYTLHSKLPGGSLSDGLNSGCISNFSNHLKKLPTKIPLTMKVFSDSSCSGTSEIGKYYFPTGLDVTQLSRSELTFDAIFQTGMLVLAPPISKRGTTPFLTEMPFIKCGTATSSDSCLTLPSMPSGLHYVISDSDNTLFIPGINDNGVCTNNTLNGWSSGTGTTSGTSNGLELKGCEYKDGGLIIKVRSIGLAQNSSVNFSFGTNSAGVTLYQYSARVSNDINIFRYLSHILGYKEIDSPPLANSLLHNDGKVDDRSQDLGIFGEISDLFSPSMVGGLFWDQTCSQQPLSNPITRTVSFKDKGSLQNYSLTLTNPPAVNTPRYIATSIPRQLTGTQAFHRRLIIRNFKGLMGYQTETVFDFACDGKDLIDFSTNLRIGRLEDYQEEVTAFSINTKQTLFFWNTSLLSNTRFERYEFETDKILTGTNNWRIQRLSTSFIRGEKINHTQNTPFNNTQLNSLNYRYNYQDNGSEELESNQFDLMGTNLTYSFYPFFRAKGQTDQPLLPGEIFSDQLFPHEKNAVLFRQKSTETPIRYLPDGKFLHAYMTGDLLKIDRFNGTSYSTFNLHDYANSSPKLIASDLSPDGSKAIVVTSEDASSSLKVSLLYNGSPLTFEYPTVSSISKKLKVVVHNNGDYLIAMQGLDDKLYFRVGSSSMTLSVLNPFAPQAISIYKLEDFQLAKDDTNQLWLSVIYSYADTTNKNYNLSYCKVSSSNPTCNLTTVDSFSELPSLNTKIESSLFNTDDGSAISLSYRKTLNGIGYEKSFTTPSSSVNFTTLGSKPIKAASFYPVEIKMGGMNLTQEIGGTALLPQGSVNAPFVPPIAPTFRMNYMSLEPSTFSSVFTPSGTFLNTK